MPEVTNEHKPGIYGFYPEGHGSYSFFTTANSEEEARAIVDLQVKKMRETGGDYETSGWGTDYYTVEYAPLGQVLTNDNS